MRKAGVVYYLHGDHLGSTSLTTCGSGSTCGGNGTETPGSRTLYYPYGQVRWPTGGSTLPTDYTFTGQRNESSFGLMDYNARYYDPALGRFIQADTIVPSPANPQSLNRYAYVLNNPVKYQDPSGHIPEVLYNETLGYYVVKLEMQIYGSGASASLAEEWQKYLNDVWNAGEYQYEDRPVLFDITVTYQDPEFTALGKVLNWLGFEGMAKPKGGEMPNLVFIAEGGVQGYRPFVTPHTVSNKDFDWGSWFSKMGKGYVFHESAHLFGIYEDRYDSITESPLPGYEDYITADAKGIFVQQPATEEVREIISLAIDRGQFSKTKTELPSR